MKKITILGAGTWGTALAAMLKREKGHDVWLWSAFSSELDDLKTNLRHPNLEGLVLPCGINYETDISVACREADFIVMAVPSPYVRETAGKIVPFISDKTVIVDVAKGLEKGTGMTLCEVIEEEIGDKNGGIVALSGPTHAEEVALGMPTAIVAASAKRDAADAVQRDFSGSFFRIYTNSDVKGIEICGAMKNIIAICSGISTGLGYGDNARAAIVTRGMAEITRLGVAMGCSGRTFESLAGIGDLVATCMSRHSRNHRAGVLIGKGYSAEDATKEVGMTVEGLNALPAALELSARLGVELPFCLTLNEVVSGRLDVREAVNSLMMRSLKPEL